MSFLIGDRVQKVKGYPFPGIVESVFEVSSGPAKGQTRVVVNCTVEAVSGCLHIYNPEQLMRIEDNPAPVARQINVVSDTKLPDAPF